jgi:membrane-bound lytic murein transglycosylase MltF
MISRKRKTPSTKASAEQADISPWLTRETPHVRRALETASRHFDKNDTMDVHTLEAVYGKESRFGQTRGKRNSDKPSGDFQIEKDLAKKMGLQVNATNDERFDVDPASAAAAKILKTSDNYFREGTSLQKGITAIPIEDAEERKKFNLAAYHAGDTRVITAQKLALQAGEDPTKWDNVKKYLEKAGEKKKLADQTCEYVNTVSQYEKTFDRKSKANVNSKYKKTKPIDPYPSGGHWITKDGRHILIKD